MKRDNRRGPELLPALPVPPLLDAAGIAALENRRDVAVLDTRPRTEFLAGHLAGAILAELDYQFCAVAGSYVEEGTPIYLLVDETRLDEAVRALIRVGLDRVAGYFTPETLGAFARTGGLLRRTEIIDMGELEARRLRGGVQVLDVRSAAEYRRWSRSRCPGHSAYTAGLATRTAAGQDAAARVLQQRRAGGSRRVVARARGFRRD